MNNARHVDNKKASCFYYQTMQIHIITPILFVKGITIIYCKFMMECSIYDIPQVLDIKW